MEKPQNFQPVEYRQDRTDYWLSVLHDKANKKLARQRSRRRKPTRSKAEVRAWLKTTEGKAWLERKIKEKNDEKARQRDLADMAEMKKRGLHFECSECLHQIGRHCLLNLPDGCGVLIDYVDVVNTGTTDSNLGQRGSEYPRIYRVVHRGQRSDGIAPVGHYRSDGAIKLAALALAAVQKEVI